MQFGENGIVCVLQILKNKKFPCVDWSQSVKSMKIFPLDIFCYAANIMMKVFYLVRHSSLVFQIL